MYSLIYVSSAVRPLSQDELATLLVTCRENNARTGITGMLLYKEGNFMQVLEGEEPAVRALYERIRTDPRHTGEILMWHGPLEGRQFGEWSMGFQDLDSEEARGTLGYSTFLNTTLSSDEFAGNPSKQQKLLLTFKRTM